MTTILVRHKVRDFAKWKSTYDTLDSFHKSNKVKSAQIFRNADNPNEVVVLTEMENVDDARRFARSEGLMNAMQNAGVADQPDVYFLDKAGSRSFT
jgi:hypothetical protein